MPRAARSEAELDKSLARLIPYQQLKGIEAVDLLVTASSSASAS
jgi:single-stranded-DNA-specific exonuclease